MARLVADRYAELLYFTSLSLLGSTLASNTFYTFCVKVQFLTMIGVHFWQR